MRRLFILVVMLTTAALLTGCTTTATPDPVPSVRSGSEHPNIVFVLTDDLSMNLVSSMPHVLGLQRTGRTMSNFFTVDSLCCPSRTATLTGQYPHDDGVFTNTGLIRERTMAGLAAARARGRVGGRPTSMTPDKLAVAARMLAEGRPKSTIAATIGVSRATLYTHLKRPDTAPNHKQIDG